jgi:type I restriction enzyme S subunit
MREGWEIKKIGDLCTLNTGGTPSRKNPEYFEGGNIKWLVSGDIHSKEIINCEGCITESGLKESNARYLPINSIMIALNGQGKTRGTVALLRTEATCNQSLVSIMPNDTKYILPEYLFINLHGRYDELRKMTGDSGNDRRGLNMPIIRSIQIPVAPLTEQKQIVALLDQAFAAIDQAKANIEKNIENSKELFQSKLNNIFSQKGDGWVEKTLGELGKPSMCKRILKEQTKTEGDIPFYKIGTFGKTPNAFISKEIYEDYKSKYSFPKIGDVLISASGTIGRRVIYDGEPAFFQDSNIVWIDNNEELVLNEYLYQFYGVCDWNPSKGATISRLYNADLKRIKISFPDKTKQKKLVEIMVSLSSKTQAVVSNYDQKLNDLAELKKSILQKAFAGELTGKAVEV